MRKQLAVAALVLCLVTAVTGCTAEPPSPQPSARRSRGSDRKGVLVTGASSGIGEATARRLATLCHTVANARASVIGSRLLPDRALDAVMRRVFRASSKSADRGR